MFLMFVSRVKPTSLQSKKPDGYTRFVCISDTLNLHRKLQYPLPDGKSWYNNSRLKELVKFTEAMLFFFVHWDILVMFSKQVCFTFPGDVLLHCGNFTDLGKYEEVVDFNDWLQTLPYEHKIVIAGNHELSFDPRIMNIVRKSHAEGSYYRYLKIHIRILPHLLFIMDICIVQNHRYILSISVCTIFANADSDST